MKSVAMLIRTSLWQQAHREHRQHLLRRAFWIGCAGPSAFVTIPFAPRLLMLTGPGASFSFHDKWHPLEMGVVEVTVFLTYLAVGCNVAPSTQN